MKLNELIEGDFFNQYIKTGKEHNEWFPHPPDMVAGDVLMLSEGRPGLDHIFSLCEGMLRLEVDKPTYERMGLEGVSIASGGRKHVKARYGRLVLDERIIALTDRVVAIELNLRLPSMVRGKKGFERIVWAFKNVLNHSVTWLFYDVKAQTVDSGPLGSHQPKMLNLEPRLETMAGVEVPELPQDFQQEEYATATELLEWLSLAISGSPRIQSDDRIDPYLSRYRVPPPVDSASDMTSRNAQDVVRFCWHGFIPPNFIKDVFLAAIKVSGTDWCGMSAVAFDGKAYSLLQHNRHTMTWEYMD